MKGLLRIFCEYEEGSDVHPEKPICVSTRLRPERFSLLDSMDIQTIQSFQEIMNWFVFDISVFWSPTLGFIFATIYQDTACGIILLECYVFPITFPIFSISRNKKVLSNLCTSVPKKYFPAHKKYHFWSFLFWRYRFEIKKCSSWWETYIAQPQMSPADFWLTLYDPGGGWGRGSSAPSSLIQEKNTFLKQLYLGN